MTENNKKSHQAIIQMNINQIKKVTSTETAVKNSVVHVLEEFNRWRRGQGEYQWNEDPAKNKQLGISPAAIGEAIDFAVEYLKNH